VQERTLRRDRIPSGSSLFSCRYPSLSLAMTADSVHGWNAYEIEKTYDEIGVEKIGGVEKTSCDRPGIGLA